MNSRECILYQFLKEKKKEEKKIVMKNIVITLLIDRTDVSYLLIDLVLV